MNLNKIFSVTLLAASILAPISGFATSLHIMNNTDEFSTTITNGHASFCSNRFPGGVTKPHQANDVPESTLRLACLGNLENCESDVYMTNNCSGSPVAKVIFSTTTGIKSVTELTSRYKMTGSGFNAQIDYYN